MNVWVQKQPRELLPHVLLSTSTHKHSFGLLGGAFIYFYMYLLCTCVHTEDKLQETLLLFHSVGSEDQIKVVRLGGKLFQPLNYLCSCLKDRLKGTPDSGLG